MDSTKREEKPNPRDSASLLSLIFNTWIIPIFWRGWKKPIDVEDLFDPVRKERSEELGNKLSSRWEDELGKRKPNLIRSLLRTFASDLTLLAVALVIMMSCSIVQSLLLGKLLSHFRPNSTVTREAAIYYTAGMLACSFLEVVLFSKYEVFAFQTGLRIRAACCAVIYRKSLKLSVTSLGEMASGQVVNLLSNDVSRFDIMMIFLHYMWLSPIVTAIIAYLLYRDSGVPGMCGLAVMIIIVMTQAYIGRLSSRFRRSIAFRTDERIRLVNEVISGINVIKMYAWENPFMRLMGNARRSEVQELRKTSIVRGIYMTFNLCANRIALFCTVVALYSFDYTISADKVFVFISYFHILTWTLGGMFVRGCAEVSESYVSILRIQKFLMNEEYNDESHVTSNTSLIKCKDSTLLNNFSENNPSKNGNEQLTNSYAMRRLSNKHPVVLSNVVAKWNLDANEPTLDRININTSHGHLHAIIGPVGAGKSSVLQTILGELPVIDGSIDVNGKISYASQDPWVFAASVKQNILFGSPYDRKRYDKVVKVCALFKDFEQFPEKDMTIVGERGVSLSGGQRARINLARAVYREADIYLLDDPLSAVDTHVGRHLFDECIRGYLKHKTVILVTHQLQYLKDVDNILLMRNGAGLASGTYQDIINSGIDYAKLLETDDEPNHENPPTDEVVKSQNSLNKLVLAERKKSTCSSFTSSMHSIHSKGSDNAEEQQQLEASSPLVDKLEASSKGMVKGSVYLHYFKAGGSTALIVVVVFLFLLTQLAVSTTDYWIAFWTKLEDKRFNVTTTETPGQLSNSTTYYSDVNLTTVSDDNMLSSNSVPTTKMCLYIYAAILLSTLLLCIFRTALYYFMVLRISKSLHKSMFKAVVGTTMRFFDTNPSGRILNRFSKDMGSVDEILPKIILDSSQIMLALFGAVCLCISTNYYLIIPLICMSVLFRFVQRFYLRTAKCVKRLEGMVRSPVFSHLNATLQGMVTIRAFGAQELLKKEFEKHQDLHSSAWSLHLSGSNAFGLTLQLFSVVYNIILLTAIFISTNEKSGGEVGLAVTQSLVLCGYLQWGIRQLAEVANNMMAAERIIEYTQLPPEEQKSSVGSTKVGDDWPSKGMIKMNHVYLKYAPLEAPVLQNLCICINPGEKIGIVGRTGAGKSSLISTLFRMAYVDGQVIIDDIDTSDVTLSRLRSSVSIIPQDPVLFSGTMRRNLDPFQEYPDELLWSALSEVELKQVLSEQEGLSTRVLEGGSNFSVGQRQLVCLARAILRANKILMMDEATANVDPQTDKLIQSTIREKFKNCTVLTVAHRLNTVIDSDRVLVMENGSVVEFDHPYLLLEKPGGLFQGMVHKMGSHGAEQLHQLAKKRYENRPGLI